MLKEKEVIYEFKSRTQMRHEKRFTIKVLHPNFQSIDDKFKWTGDTTLVPELKDSQHFAIEMLDSKFGLDRYRIKINNDRRYSKNDTLGPIMVVFKNMEDPEKRSSLHLSSGVYEITDKLVLKVLFEPSLSPINGRKLEYIHYTDDDHYSAESIEPELEGNKKCYRWEIDKPLYGGKYMIEWEFE